MQSVAQRGVVARPATTHFVFQCPRRARPALVTLAVSCPGNNTSLQSQPQHASWAQKFVRATVVATTLQFFAAASHAANASVGGGIGAGGGHRGGGGGGGGGGDGHSSMSHGGSPTVLGDIAEASSDLVEEVVLLDVGGEARMGGTGMGLNRRLGASACQQDMARTVQAAGCAGRTSPPRPSCLQA